MATPISQLVLIPSYNSGAKLQETVAESLRHNIPVWVIIDGSTDGTGEKLAAWAKQNTNLRVLIRPRNGGKGAAVLDGLRAANAEGLTHVLVMDGDGQHPAALIPEFISLSRQRPDAMILGDPIFDGTAPRLRVICRRLSNALAKIETFGAIGDSLFGFRVYPIAPLLAVMESTNRMRRFDFDAEAAVRLIWRGVPAINQPAPVRYFRKAEGGVTHFRYGRDNLLLTAMHARLMAEFLLRRFRSSRHLSKSAGRKYTRRGQRPETPPIPPLLRAAPRASSAPAGQSLLSETHPQSPVIR
jgi:glycosyltransferase involved in cell wall biosynthesis